MWRQRPPRRGHDGTVRGPGLRGRHGAGAAEAPPGHRFPGAGAPAAGVSSGEAAGGGRRGPEARPRGRLGSSSGCPRGAARGSAGPGLGARPAGAGALVRLWQSPEPQLRVWVS